MKSQGIIAFILVCLLAISAGAQAHGAAQPAEGPIAQLAQQASGETESPSAALVAEQDAGTYPERLEAVVAAMSAELNEIAQAARERKISRDQAEYLSLERYYVALTRFQLLRAMYTTPQAPQESNPAQSYPQANTPAQMSAGTLVIPQVTCSPDIPRQLIDYLELTPVEIQALEAQVTEECKQVKPLVEKLENSRRKLMAMKLDGKADDQQVQRNAAQQSQIMTQLIVMNSQLEAKLYSMLTTEQQRKVDGLLRQSLSSQENPQAPE
jgi:hypothetical protein